MHIIRQGIFLPAILRQLQPTEHSVNVSWIETREVVKREVPNLATVSA